MEEKCLYNFGCSFYLITADALSHLRNSNTINLQLTAKSVHLLSDALSQTNLRFAQDDKTVLTSSLKCFIVNQPVITTDIIK